MINIVTPEDFGTVGEGDDTEAVQAWIDDALNMGEGLHLLGNHEYVCQSGLTINGQGSDLWCGNNILLGGCGSGSKLTVNGDIGIFVNRTLGTNFLKLVDFQVSSESTTNTLLKTMCIYGLMVLDGITFRGGGKQLHLTANGSSGGSLSLQAKCCEFDSANEYAVLGQAQLTNLVENANFDGCQFFQFAKTAVFLDGCDSISFTNNCRWERPSNNSVWPQANTVIKIINSFDIKFRDCYIEDGCNTHLIDVGNSFRISVENCSMSINVTGQNGYNNSSAFQTIGQPVSHVAFNRNRITSQGSVNQVYSANISYLERRYNRMDVLGTAQYGFQDGTGTGMNSEGNVVNGSCANKFTFSEPKRT